MNSLLIIMYIRISGIRTNQYKLVYFYTIGEWELYDLTKGSC